MAFLIKKIIKQFDKIRTFEKVIHLENDLNQNAKLTFELPTNVKFTEEEIMSILSKIFYKPDSLSDTGKWLERALLKGFSKKETFSSEIIKNEIVNILLDKTKVLVEGGKNYDSLSLGQKSIYGLKYKFNKSKNDNLFLDQPEDNLDNNTIVSEVLPLIKDKEQQVFIVTHNANIGILSNPELIIVCNLNNLNKPYESIRISKLINDRSINFLEGGKKALEQRFNKMMEGNVGD